MGAKGSGHAHRWDPETYLAFSDERGRPFEDLMSRVGAVSPVEWSTWGRGRAP